MKSIGQMVGAVRATFTKYMDQRNLWKQKALELARENERLKIEAQQSRAMLLQLRVDPGVYHARSVSLLTPDTKAGIHEM